MTITINKLRKKDKLFVTVKVSREFCLRLWAFKKLITLASAVIGASSEVVVECKTS